MTSENSETQSWVGAWVTRIPGRRARNSKTPTTITVHSIPRNDQLPLTGGPQNVDDWWRRLFVCNFPSCTAELFHEDIGTPARRAWLARTWSATSSQWSSSCSSGDKPQSNFGVLLTTPGSSEFITRCNLSVVTFGNPANGVAVVNARSHKRMDECCCWLRI